jgi:capsule polysaccharide export protein KpsE/RkpR
VTELSASEVQDPDRVEQGETTMDTLIALAERWRLLLLAPLAAGLLALGITYLIAPTYTARTSFLPPQQQGGPAASALAALGPLAALAGGAGGLRTPADQFVALMQSTTVLDQLLDRFELIKVYESKFRSDARKDLADHTRITLSKRDGIITVEFDDESPQRAAEVANAYVDELRRLTSKLAITEAQQRRMFFERQLQQTRDRLTVAQVALQGSGFSAGALKAEPKAAAESYARLKAELTAAEVRLQALRTSLVDNAPEIMQQLSMVSSLRGQLAKTEQINDTTDGPDYIGKYREFKYQETLFELFSRQYELARMDEAREGALIQVIDAAAAPEKKSKPKRAITAVATTVVTGLLLLAWVMVARAWRRMAANSQGVDPIGRLKLAVRGR